MRTFFLGGKEIRSSFYVLSASFPVKYTASNIMNCILSYLTKCLSAVLTPARLLFTPNNKLHLKIDRFIANSEFGMSYELCVAISYLIRFEEDRGYSTDDKAIYDRLDESTSFWNSVQAI